MQKRHQNVCLQLHLSLIMRPQGSAHPSTCVSTHTASVCVHVCKCANLSLYKYAPVSEWMCLCQPPTCLLSLISICLLIRTTHQNRRGELICLELDSACSRCTLGYPLLTMFPRREIPKSRYFFHHRSVGRF